LREDMCYDVNDDMGFEDFTAEDEVGDIYMSG
jgi:hypothetical protein